MTGPVALRSGGLGVEGRTQESCDLHSLHYEIILLLILVTLHARVSFTAIAQPELCARQSDLKVCLVSMEKSLNLWWIAGMMISLLTKIKNLIYTGQNIQRKLEVKMSSAPLVQLALLELFTMQVCANSD